MQINDFREKVCQENHVYYIKTVMANNLYANNIVTTSLATTSLNLTNLTTASTTLTNLNVTNVTTTSLVATSGTISNLLVTNNGAATNTSTGALVVSGGLGISGTLNTSGFNFVNRAYGYISGQGGQVVIQTTTTLLTTAYWNGTAQTAGGMTFGGGTFTIPTTGTYVIHAQTVSPINATGTERTLVLYINGFQVNLGGNVSYPVQTNRRTDSYACDVLQLNAGDTVSIAIWQNSTSTMTMETGTPGFFRIIQL
jgi:hypothetical protein